MNPNASQPAAPEADVPRINLAQIHWDGDTASAPLLGGDGGKAELTLRADIQTVAERLLTEARPIRGAILMTDVRSGRLIAYGEFSRAGSGAGVALEPAPTASLFKLVTMASLYEQTNVVPKTWVCFDGGAAGVESKHLHAPPDKTGLCAPFWLALGHSRNAVFAQLATERLQRKDLEQTAERIGFNGDVPFDAPARFGSLELPSDDLEFARAAAGFVGSEVSPLGMHWFTLAIATEGMAPRLTMIRRAGDYVSPRRRVLVKRLLDATTAYRLVRAMEVTIHSGTSLEAFTAPSGSSYLGGLRVAGKTGTLHRKGAAATTSWFTGFAPSRAPRVAVTVLLQNSDVWRRKANELGRDLLRTYFANYPGVTPPFPPAR